MEIQSQNQYGEVYQQASLDKSNNWIYSKWFGYLNTHQLMAGIEDLLKLVKESGCPNVIVDSREVLGMWHEVNDWLEHEILPKAEEAGMLKLAQIVVPGTAAAISAELLEKNISGEHAFMVFHNLDEAIQWIEDEMV